MNLKGTLTSIGKAEVNRGIAISLNSLNYLRRPDGTLKFRATNRSIADVYATAAKILISQRTYAELNNLVPKLIRKIETKTQQEALEQNLTTIIDAKNTNNVAVETLNKNNDVVVTHRGQAINDGILLWVPSATKATTTHYFTTYYDRVVTRAGNAESTTKAVVPGEVAFLDLSALVSMNSANNLILTKVQGRDATRKELVSGGDLNFSISGKIMGNIPDVYPTGEVSKFIELMQYQGVLGVSGVLFQQLNVTQIVIKDWNMNQSEGCKNVQPYTFTCVGIEAGTAVTERTDTLNSTQLWSTKTNTSKWGTILKKIHASGAETTVANAIGMLTTKI